MNKQEANNLMCPRCRTEFYKRLTSFNRTAFCETCQAEVYALLLQCPDEYAPPAWYRYRPTEFDVIRDSGVYIVREV